MLDFPQVNPTKCNIQQYFYDPAIPHYVWEKPKGCTFVLFYFIGGGGGGGGGISAALGTSRGGGGGGGVASSAFVMAPAFIFPDTLRITVGAGGTGGTAGNSGTVGESSSLFNFTTGGYTLTGTLFSASGGNGGGTPSGTGSTGTGGSGGGSFSGAAIVGITLNTFLIPSQNDASSNGGLTTGTNITVTAPLKGGCGGGGADTSNVGYAGGSYTGSTPYLNPAGGGPGLPGANGLSTLTPIFFPYGGAGGGGNGTGTGGRGGNGGIGCGGGGGGGGVTGGAGGNGGNGYAMSVSW